MTMAENKTEGEFQRWATTARQVEILNAWEAADRNTSNAARSLGVIRETVKDTVLKIKKRAAKSGFAPEHHHRQVVPDGYYVKGTSTFYDEEGKPKLQWVKSQIDHGRQQEILEEAFHALSAELPALPKIAKPGQKLDSELLNFYPVTDAHLGMLAWGPEAGEDWDLSIGAKALCDGFGQMVERSPNASECLIAQMGDYLHTDSLDPVTPTSRHLLDTDSRFPKLAEVAVKTLRTLIETALRKHAKVHLIIAEGNHDIVSSIWLRVMFRELYANQPRLIINESVEPYYCHRHGETFLGVHHGHLKGIDGANGSSLALLFADRPEWGSTQFRYIHTGHKHAAHEREVHGAVLQQHPTFAARDAYAARHGWKSVRKMSAISYHKKHGECFRSVVTPSMIT